MENNSNKQNIIYGVHPILEALYQDKPIVKIFINQNSKSSNIKKIISLSTQKNISIKKVPIFKLNKLCSKTHQGIVAYISPIYFTKIDNVIMNCYENKKHPFILILDHLTDIRNIGAIIRTAECFGVDAIVLPSGTMIHSDLIKTSSGALNNVNICISKNLYNTINELKNFGLRIYALTEHAQNILTSYKSLDHPICIIIGAENKGISEKLINISDEKIKIEMYGKTKSLNVSVATAISCFWIRNFLN